MFRKIFNGTRAKVFLTAVAVCLFSLVLFVACDSKLRDNSFKNEDYIEVQSLRFSGENPTAEIYMSSSGDPSFYQLEIDVVPKNATNRAVEYYISTEYHQFVTVTKDGLLQAHLTSSGTKVPVVIRSTTNRKAVINATVVVEDVAVEKIGFQQDDISLLYNGKNEQIKVEYSPAHAIDGRNATFTSQNENIATVDANGVVTPVGVGYTHIWATCSTRSNKIIKNQIEVHVSYVMGQYQLDVTGDPNFSQVIGDYTPIDFTLLILGENVDPEPKIKWYVDTEPVPDYNDKLQYTHVPEAQTQMTYRVKAIVTPYQGSPVELYSDEIDVHMAFNGINLVYENQSSVFDSYRYGDTATFPIKVGDAASSIAKYKWYIADYIDSTHKKYIAETTPSSRDLTRRINVAGDYILTVEAVDQYGDLVSQRLFYFSAEKLIEGDTLIVRPKMNDYGLPPDSYHWYIVACDENGNYNEDDKVFIQDTATEDILYYPLKRSGNYKFIVTATINGVNATISVNGKQEQFEYVSDIIRVYSRSFRDTAKEDDLIDLNNADLDAYKVKYYDAVQSVYIEGMGRDGKYEAMLHWNDVQEIPSFQVEITRNDGSVAVLDSQNKTINRFGSDYCYIDNDIVSLSDVFSVRVKQKRGFYSTSFYYGTPNEKGVGDRTHIIKYDESDYGYFETIGFNNVLTEYSSVNAAVMDAPAINGYLSDMSEMQKLLYFILLYRPQKNSYINYNANISRGGKLYSEYSVDVYIGFQYSDAIETKYPHGLTEDDLAPYGLYSEYAKMVYGAIREMQYGYDFELKIERGGKQGITIYIDIPFVSAGIGGSVLKDTLTEKGRPADPDSYVLDKSDEVDIKNLPISLKEEISVRDSEEMAFVLENGYQPVPSVESLSTLYKKIKSVAVRIVNKGMTDEEKLLAFYDYIGLNTIIDAGIEEERGKAMSKYSLYLFEEFRLEGVFSRNKAVDVGIAKAYSALCAIYGIPCQTVTAKIKGETHAYNKVSLNGKYYIVDLSKCMYVSEGYSIVSHDLFMVPEDEYLKRFDTELEKSVFYGDSPIASTVYGNKAELPHVTSRNDYLDIVEDVKKRDAGVYGIEFTVSFAVYYNMNALKQMMLTVLIEGVNVSEAPILVYEDEKTYKVIVLMTVYNDEE